MEYNQQQLIEELKKKVEMIPVFLERESIIEWCKNPKFKSWKTSTLRIIERLSWNKDSSYVKDFSKISFMPGVFISWMPDSVFREAFVKWIKSAECTLDDMISEFETFWIPENEQANKQTKSSINIVNTLNQNQTINVDIKTIFKDELTGKQFQELENILKEKDKSKLKKFLETLWTWTVIELLKTLAIKMFF